MSRLFLSVVALAAALGLVTSAAAEVMEVPATPVARFGNSSSFACQAFYFLQWPEVENGTSWRAEWKYNGFPKSKTAAPPFDDRTHADRGWVAPKGVHWIEYGYTAEAGLPGGPAVDCAKYPGVVLPATTDAKVLVTVKDDARIVGKVTDTDGDPVPGVLVRAKGAGRDRTDADGEYEIDVPERARKYVVTPSLRGQSFKPRKRSVTVRAGQTKRANFRAKVKRYEISGTVTTENCDATATSCEATPQQGVLVAARGPASRSAVTDDSGRYSIKLRRGSYRIAARGDYNSVLPEPIVVSKDRDGVDFVGCDGPASTGFSQLQLSGKPPCNHELSGILRNGDRKPISYWGDVLISGLSANGNGVNRRLSAKRGRFEITLPPGDYRVTTSTPRRFSGPDIISVRLDRDRVVILRSAIGCRLGNQKNRHVTHLGSDKADRIVVTNARTRAVIVPGAGNDRVITTGPVNVCGSPGRNRITTGFGDDLVQGGRDGEVISTGPGDDYVVAGRGDDTISGGFGDDTIFGGSGADTIRGGAGADTLRGGSGADALYGSFGDDTLDVGGGANTVLFGGSGTDVCTGQALRVSGCP